jgi:hypothetical protein
MVGKVHNCVDIARPHEVGDGHDVEHCGRVVSDCEAGAFCFAERLVGIRGRELYTNAHASTHLAGHSRLKYRVGVGSNDMGEGARRRVMACMQVVDLQQD